MNNEVFFSQVDNNVAEYPKPVIPMLPLASIESFLRPYTKVPCDAIIFGANYCTTYNGRSALAHVLKLANSQPNEKILLPSYHCRTMIEPAIYYGMNVAFYKLNANLSIDLDDLISKIDSNTKAILITHYFGFGQPSIKEIAKITNAKGIILIEDCAHGFYGKVDGSNFGTYGNYAIASSRKFFPSSDGGLLISKAPLNLERLSSQQFYSQLKSFYQCIHYSTDYYRNRFLALPLKLISLAKKVMQNGRQSSEQPLQDNICHFSVKEMRFRSSWYSRWLIKHSNHQKIIHLRRKNFRYLQNQLSEIKVGQPFYPELPEDVTPYVFPFYLQDPDTHFPILKNSGFPIWRWDELADSSCSISKNLGAHLIQIPCHQSLRKNELDWMVDKIRCLENTAHRNNQFTSSGGH